MSPSLASARFRPRFFAWASFSLSGSPVLVKSRAASSCLSVAGFTAVVARFAFLSGLLPGLALKIAKRVSNPCQNLYGSLIDYDYLMRG